LFEIEIVLVDDIETSKKDSVDGEPEKKIGLSTVNTAIMEVTEPASLVITARYWLKLSERKAALMSSVAAVSPTRSTNTPDTFNCH